MFAIVARTTTLCLETGLGVCALRSGPKPRPPSRISNPHRTARMGRIGGGQETVAGGVDRATAIPVGLGPDDVVRVCPEAPANADVRPR